MVQTLPTNKINKNTNTHLPTKRKKKIRMATTYGGYTKNLTTFLESGEDPNC